MNLRHTHKGAAHEVPVLGRKGNMRKFILAVLWAALGAAEGAMIGIALMLIWGTEHASAILISTILSGAITSAITYCNVINE